MKKLAILGANYLQKPLVKKAKKMGLQTHVFAWEEGNVVGDITDYYYPISVLEKEEILEKCREIGIDGVTSIASDIVMPTVNYIADELDLVGNSLESTKVTTDKFYMRQALSEAGIPCPKFVFYDESNFENGPQFTFPVIVKPTDRSGSRGVTKVNDPLEVNCAIEKALDNSLKHRAIVEEFIEGRELSVEMISHRGDHHFLSVTEKVTTGPPFFVEMEHHQPAEISKDVEDIIIETVRHGLDVLKIKNGASHSEILITPNNDIRIIEIAGRMGGDFIGSHLVYHTTGFDYMKAVIEIALGNFHKDDFRLNRKDRTSAYFLPAKAGTVESIKSMEHRFLNVLFAKPLVNVGDKLGKAIDSSKKRSGVVVSKNTTNREGFSPASVLQIEVSR